MSPTVLELPVPPEETDALQSPAIEFRHVSLSLDERPVLRDVSFVLPHGEMIALTGPSGSGKSVLLHLAIGLILPDEGEIFIEGREIEHLSEDELLAIRGGLMGIVFQEDALFTGLTVYENAAYRLVEHKWPAAETERAVREVLQFVGLEEDLEKFPAELSGGMKRRLEIARALVGWPRVMLFDEPTSGLDPINAGQVLDLIIRARDVHRISSLFVTKELHEIPYLAYHYAAEGPAGAVEIYDARPGREPALKVMLLDEGQVAFQGSAAEFAASQLPAVRYMTQH